MNLIFRTNGLDKATEFTEEYTPKGAVDRLKELHISNPGFVTKSSGLTLVGISGDNHEKVALFAGSLTKGIDNSVEVKDLIDRPISVLEYEFEKGKITEQQLADFVDTLEDKIKNNEIVLSAERKTKVENEIKDRKAKIENEIKEEKVK
jgi:hypothetical protein